MSDDFSKGHTQKGVTGGPVANGSASAGDNTGESVRSVNSDLALFESLSALMDDQADELELRRLLKAMPANADLQAKWQRFHMVRSSLKQEMHARPAVNLVEGINTRLAAESVALPSQSRFANPALRFIAQGLIAASFFAMTIMATSVFNQSGTGAQPAIADATGSAATPVLGGEYKASELSRTASLENEMDEEALAQLRQAVDQQFSEDDAAPEIPVSYSFELPVTDDPAP